MNFVSKEHGLVTKIQQGSLTSLGLKSKQKNGLSCVSLACGSQMSF